MDSIIKPEARIAAENDPFRVEGISPAFMAETAELAADDEAPVNVGDTVSYRDWPGQDDSFLRTGRVVKVEGFTGAWLLTLKNLTKDITWIDWYADHMTVTAPVRDEAQDALEAEQERTGIHAGCGMKMAEHCAACDVCPTPRDKCGCGPEGTIGATA